MSWWAYVQRVADTTRQRDISDMTGVDATEVTRWKNGKAPSPLKVAAFARGYGKPVLEAFVAAEFLTPKEAGEKPSAPPDYSQLTNDELLELVRARMREEGEFGGETATPSDGPPGPFDEDLDNLPPESDDPSVITGRSLKAVARKDDEK